MTFAQFRRGYQAAGILLLNTCIMIVVLNVFIGAAYYARHFLFQRTNLVSTRLGLVVKPGRSIAEIYPDLGPAEVDRLLAETWSRPFMFEPFTQFRERPGAGTYVNVSEHGFRIGLNQGPWPPDRQRYYTVFLFGGSTTFGYGVGDVDTLGSALQAALRSPDEREVRVYNFGRGHYFSTQERILFENLLNAGDVPDAAVFVDGINEFYYESSPLFSDEFTRLVDGQLLMNFEAVPIVRATKTVAAKLRGAIRTVEATGPASSDTEERRQTIDRVIARYQANRRTIEAVAKAQDVKTLFVWQPSPTYGYDLRYHVFTHARFELDTAGYPRMARVVADQPPGADFLWCADIQRGLTEALYVDSIHYSAKMLKNVAACIARGVEDKGLLKP